MVNPMTAHPLSDAELETLSLLAEGGYVPPTTASPLLMQRLLATISRDRSLLNERDNFIVLQGLWTEFVEKYLPDRDRQKAPVGEDLQKFVEKVRDMTTGGTWKEMLDNDIELMKEANALLSAMEREKGE